MIGIQSSSNAGQSQRPSLSSIGLIEFGSRARLIRVRVGCPVSYRNSFLPVARFGSCYVRITVGYGDPARGQVRKLLRFRKLDRTHTVLRSERANKIASGVKLFLFGHGKGRRDRHQQNIRMFVGYGGSARGQPRKL